MSRWPDKGRSSVEHSTRLCQHTQLCQQHSRLMSRKSSTNSCSTAQSELRLVLDSFLTGQLLKLFYNSLIAWLRTAKATEPWNRRRTRNQPSTTNSAPPALGLSSSFKGSPVQSQPARTVKTIRTWLDNALHTTLPTNTTDVGVGQGVGVFRSKLEQTHDPHRGWSIIDRYQSG